MSSKPCLFHLTTGCRNGSACTFSHQKPISGMKSSRSPEICRYFLKGQCVFGDGCRHPHMGELKEASGYDDRSKGASSSYESDNSGTTRSDKGSAGDGEEVQEDSLPSEHVSDSPPSKEAETDEKDPDPDPDSDPDVQDSCASQDANVLDPSPSNTNVDGETADTGICIFFLEGSCRDDSGCSFSHTIPSDTSSSHHKGPLDSSSPYKKACKLYRQGRCQAENDCSFLHSQTKPSIAPDTSTDLTCRLDSPFDRPNGEEDNISPEPRDAYEIKGNTIDDVIHGEAQSEMNKTSSDEFNKKSHPDPDQPIHNDEDYQEQLHRIDNPSDDQIIQDTVETCHASQAEPINKGFRMSKPASYYGDGWEERSPPPIATQLQKRRQVALPVVPPPPTYPHISEIIPHWTQFADPYANKDVPFCKQLAQGGCSQGDKCRFRHSLTVGEYILLFNDQQPNLWTLQRNGVSDVTASSPASEVQPQMDSSYSSSVAVARPLTFNQECKFYPIGKCRNGDLCPFWHTQHPIVPTITVSNADQDWQTSERPTLDAQNSQRPCKFYIERGYCSRGLSCKFRHGDHLDSDHLSSGPSAPESTPSTNDDDRGWSTSWEEGNKVNDDNSGATPTEDNGWGTAAASEWGAPSALEDHSAWNSPGEKDHSAWDSPGENDYSKPPPRKPNVCFKYAEGFCHRGDACKFSHDQKLSNTEMSSEAPKTDDDSARWNTATPVQCPYNLKGNCRNGSLCHMSHDFEERPQDKGQSEESDKQENFADDPGESAQNEAQSNWDTEGEPKTSNEDLSKAQEGDSQNSHILDNEATWSQPWPTETVQPPSFPINYNAPCKRFGQGYCPFGDECSYLHMEDSDIIEYASNSEEDVSRIPLANRDEEIAEEEFTVHDKPDSSIAIEPEPIIFDHPVVERPMLNCTVGFGIDATPDQITTAAESKKLILSNMPVDVSPTNIKELAEPFGEIHSVISLDETEDNARIEVEFAESSQALGAFKHLNGQFFESRTISANLKSRISMTVRSSEHTHVIKVSWPTPSATAWIHYATVSQAKSEAIRLDGVIVGGLQIKAVYVPPLKRQKSSFAVEIRGLPVDVSRALLQELCPEQSFITLDPPCYTQDPTNAIRFALARYGEVEDIDIPASALRLASVMAFATFKSGEAALEAMEALNGHNQDFLGGQPLSLRHVYYFRHRATIPQFEAVKNEIDRLSEKGEKKCIIQYQEQRERKIVWIRIHALVENRATFASLNTELAALLRGMLLTSNGDTVWDDYLETSSSAKSIDTINTTNSEGPFFVQRDCRMKNVRIFGASPDQERAKKLVMRMLQKVHKLQHEIQLPRKKLHDLVNGGLRALQDDLGANKLSLDVTNSKLIIRGGPDDDSKVEDYIGSLDSLSTPETTEGLCEICQHLPVDPILLTCRHAYCTLCLQMALRHSLNAPFQCISRATSENGLTTQCPANVPYVVIRDILPNEEKNFLHASFLSYIRSNSEKFFFCPTLDCQSAYRTGFEDLNLKCSLCVSEICTSCQTRAHIGIACKENRT